MNIIIPFLGKGSRFAAAGFTEPKALIRIKGKYMFEWACKAIESYDLERHATCVISQEQADRYDLGTIIRKTIGSGIRIHISPFETNGAMCTVLLVRDTIDTDQELIVYNADQYFKLAVKKYIVSLPNQIAGAIPYFSASHPRWSYIQTNAKNHVVRTAEKEVISNKATVGLYYFRTGRDFVRAADEMIAHKVMTGNEYYVCPVYNELIHAGKTIAAVPVSEMWSLGTPEDVEKFIKYYKDFSIS